MRFILFTSFHLWEGDSSCGDSQKIKWKKAILNLPVLLVFYPSFVFQDECCGLPDNSIFAVRMIFLVSVNIVIVMILILNDLSNENVM